MGIFRTLLWAPEVLFLFSKVCVAQQQGWLDSCSTTEWCTSHSGNAFTGSRNLDDLVSHPQKKNPDWSKGSVENQYTGKKQKALRLEDESFTIVGIRLWSDLSKLSISV